MKNNLFLFLISLLLFPVAAFSQMSVNPIKVKGQIIDSTIQKSIPFATITIMKVPENTIEQKIAANDDGNFETYVKKPGSYILKITSLGYSNTSKHFNVQNGQILVDFGKVLVKESTKELGSVQIVAEKPLIKVETDKLSYSAESDPESKTLTALDMLRKVPLVTVDGEDNIQLKGSSNFKIFLNGKPSTMVSSNPKDFLKNLPASTIKNIEVITNPGSKYDAEGIGGIINIVTMKKESNGYTCSVNAGGDNLGTIRSGVYFAASFGKFGISTNLSTNYRDMPYYANSSFSESKIRNDLKYNYGEGKSKRKGMFSWGNGELSYEIDTLNLISASFGFWLPNNKNYSESTVNIKNSNDVLVQAYTSQNNTSFNFGEPEANIDYQHIFKQNKEQILTLSYKINYEPNTNETTWDAQNILNYTPFIRNSKNDATSAEHTFQTDYVQPLNKTGKIEVGLKYIYRKNKSESTIQLFNYSTGLFYDDPTLANNLDYSQNIYAAYASYNLSWNKVGIKLGVRAEKSELSYSLNSFDLSENRFKDNDFGNNNLEYVPSASINYQLTPMKSLRLSYNMRIQRPGMWFLNPYVNRSPSSVNYGNPDLEPERYHSFDLNFNSFSQLGNINLTLNYSFANNAIGQVNWRQVENNQTVDYSTYGNNNKIQTVGASVFMGLRFGRKVNLNLNGSVNYNDLQGTNGLTSSNQGWGGNVYANCQYTIIKGFKLSFYGGVFQPTVQLESKMSTFYFSGMSVNKEFYDGKLNISVSARDIFWNEMKFTFETNTSTYYSKNESFRPGRSFGFNISYRFGEMKNQIKKAERGINNDDLKKGGDGNNGGGN